MSICRSVVRILDKDDELVGGGCLVTSGFIATCAHVVQDALGIPKDHVNGGEILGHCGGVRVGHNKSNAMALAGRLGHLSFARSMSTISDHVDF